MEWPKKLAVEDAFGLLNGLSENLADTEACNRLLEKIKQQPHLIGEAIRFIREGGYSGIRGSAGPILKIDRAVPFNPAKFLGPKWSIWRGPLKERGKEGEENQDARSVALAEIDLSQVSLEVIRGHRPQDSAMVGSMRHYVLTVERARQGCICLDAKIFEELWNNQGRIPEEWKTRKFSNEKWITFDGTVLRSPDGSASVIMLHFLKDTWFWRVKQHYCVFNAFEMALILKPEQVVEPPVEV